MNKQKIIDNLYPQYAKQEHKPNNQFWIMFGIAIMVWFIILASFILARAKQEPDWDKVVSIIIQIESSGNPNAISKNGCIGLMQISPLVLKEYNWYVYATGTDDPPETYTKNDLFNKDINITIGTWYLKRIWLHYLGNKGTINDMLICYNFGYGNWLKYKQGKIKLPKETINYLKKFHNLLKGGI